MKLYKKHDWNKKYLIENIEEIKGSTRVINTTLKKKKEKKKKTTLHAIQPTKSLICKIKVILQGCNDNDWNIY